MRAEGGARRQESAPLETVQATLVAVLTRVEDVARGARVELRRALHCIQQHRRETAHAGLPPHLVHAFGLRAWHLK